MQCDLDLHRPLAIHVVFEGPSLDILLGDVIDPVLFANHVHLNDVGVVQASRCRGLVSKTFDVLFIREIFGTQDLDGNLPPQRRLFGEIDFRHATRAELFQQTKLPQHRVGRVGWFFRIHGIRNRKVYRIRARGLSSVWTLGLGHGNLISVRGLTVTSGSFVTVANIASNVCGSGYPRGDLRT